MSKNVSAALVDALVALQQVLRRHGLQGLAVHAPVLEVQSQDDLRIVQQRLATIRKLMGLRAPPEYVQMRVNASFDRVNVLIGALETALRENPSVLG